MSETKLCECGCGEKVKPGRRFINGHCVRVNHPMKSMESRKKQIETKRIKREIKLGIRPAPESKYCECGCGQVVKEGDKFIHGHNSRINHPMKDKHHTEDTKKKMSESKKGKTWEEIYGEEIAERKREQIINRLKGKHLTDETKEKIRKEHKGKKHPISEEGIKNILRASHKRPTKPEKELLSILQFLFSNEYEYVGNGKLIIKGKCPDFVNVNGQKKVIELYGDFWHKDDDLQDRIDYFKQYGWDTLVIWEHELKDERAVINRVLEFHGLHSQRDSIQLTMD